MRFLPEKFSVYFQIFQKYYPCERMVTFMGNKFLQYFALTIAVIGAVNWGLIGFFNVNLVSLLFGSMSWLSRIIYGLVGLCGLYLLTFYGLVDRNSQEI